MTVSDLLARADSRELTEWQLLYQLKHEEDEQEKHGDIIIHDGAARLETEDEAEDVRPDDDG